MSTQALEPAQHNMRVWEAVSRPPSTALKQIKGGRLAGMTDINPQWRYQAMTSVFGPIGEGWKYEVVKLWTEPATEGQVLAFAQVEVRWLDRSSGWSDPIPGIGGSMLIAKESGGLRTNDEAYKMAVTDALSVALKTLGVAADIYAGLWDGSKYKEEAVQPTIKMPRRMSEGESNGSRDGESHHRDDDSSHAPGAGAVGASTSDINHQGRTAEVAHEHEETIQLALKASIAVNEAAEGVIDEPQRRRLFAFMREGGHTKEAVSAWLLREHGISSSKNIPASRYQSIAERLKSREALNG